MKALRGLTGLLLFFGLTIVEKKHASPTLITSYVLLGLFLIAVTLIAYLFVDSLDEIGRDSKKLAELLGLLFLLFLLRWVYLNLA